MDNFHDISIKRKLIIITMLTSIVALLVASAAILIYEQLSFRKLLERSFWTLSGMVQENVAPALAFDDRALVETTLRSLSAHERILAGVAYDEKGEVFGVYRRADAKDLPLPAPAAEGSVFTGDQLQVFRDVWLGGEKIGALYLAADLKEATDRLVNHGAIMVLILVGAAAAAYVLSLRLQRVISKPLLHLAEVASRVATEKNTALRAEKQGNDELGELIDRFNQMLAQIQMQDLELMHAKNQLERRVEERTRELSQEIADRIRTEEDRDNFFTVTLDMLGVADLAGNLRRVNPAFCRTLGFREDELTARSFVDLVHPDDRERTLEEVEKVAGGVSSFDFETRCIDAKGPDRWILWTLAPSVERGLIYACGRDITERKKAQAELAEAHEKLLDASRSAGMAEVATSVLHNVGNVLNSVGVSAEVVGGKVRQLRIGSLEQLAALLKEHEHDLASFLTEDPRGRQLPAYLLKLVEHLTEPQRQVFEELESLRKNIDHIKEVISMQQTYARGVAFVESLVVADLIEDAIRMNGVSFTRHEIEVIREFEDLPKVMTDRHKVLQILVNILSNAKHAVRDQGGPKEIRVRASREGDQWVKIEVIDRGIGIEPENLTRIFQHGFTTKRNGHGFGLHSGALAARQLGGSLAVHSEGVGQGAVVTLTLPVGGEA